MINKISTKTLNNSIQPLIVQVVYVYQYFQFHRSTKNYNYML